MKGKRKKHMGQVAEVVESDGGGAAKRRDNCSRGERSEGGEGTVRGERGGEGGEEGGGARGRGGRDPAARGGVVGAKGRGGYRLGAQG